MIGGRVALQHVVKTLLAFHRHDLLELLNVRLRKVGQADIADLSGLLDVRQRLGGFLNRNIVIRPVHLINVDMIGAKPLEAAVNLFHEAGTGEVVAGLVVFVPEQTGLGGDDHLVAQAAFLKDLSEHFLGMIPAIHRSNVEEIDAIGNRRVDDFTGIVIVA